ncbi:MAG: hypothetical protein ACRDD7_10815 [Peptostreptococcaceae bacterium]
MKYIQFNCACISVEEREKIKLLSSQLKTKSDERVAEVLIRALELLKKEER